MLKMKKRSKYASQRFSSLRAFLAIESIKEENMLLSIYGYSSIRFLSTLPIAWRSISWYYATDIPRSKPYDPKYKPISFPKKFEKFTEHDSIKLQETYQRYLTNDNSPVNVQVSEDELFTVNFKKMELKPTFWEGPSFEVRRGLWFYKDEIPLNEKLSNEIEKLSKYHFMNRFEDNIFKIENASVAEAKYVLFINDKEGYLLDDLEGGSFQMQYLKSGLAQYLGIYCKRILRYDKEHGASVKDKSEIVKSQPTANKDISGEIKKQDKAQDYSSSWINWDFFNQLSTSIGTFSAKHAFKDSKDNMPSVELKTVKSDYGDQDKSQSNSKRRDVQHLILCVHGIGQTLGKDSENVNFSHTVNLLRSNIKNIYNSSANLKNLNKSSDLSDWDDNCNVQVLPITWRHSINFPTENGDNRSSNQNFATLSDITINSILPLRRLMGDVAVDILLYEEPFYRKQILREVHKKMNRTFESFMKYNPEFSGEVHLIGHSLGSVILLDILSDPAEYLLDFDVRKFFCIGSPIGLLKLIERCRILPKGEKNYGNPKVIQPQCQDIYNIYHTCDPIASRVEPLVHPDMARYSQAAIPHLSEYDNVLSKVLEIGGSLLEKLPTSKRDDPDAKKSCLSDQTIPSNIESLLLKLNHLGRIDYALSPNMLEVDMIAAIVSHVAYFEDPDIAGFLLREVLGGYTTKG